MPVLTMARFSWFFVQNNKYNPMYKHNFRDLLDTYLFDYSSTSDSSSSDEDDLDILLVEMAFASKVYLGQRLNFQDLSDSECKQMFRYANLRIFVSYY